MTTHAPPSDCATRLLVSARDAVEAEIVLRAGVSLLDVKEPLAGPLGAASDAALREVLAVAARFSGPSDANNATRDNPTLIVSAALGELLDYQPRRFPPGLKLAKFGLAGCARHDDWRERWRAAVEGFPTEVSPVAVVYADAVRAAAPAASEVLEQGQTLGCRYVLVDTFDKSSGGLLDHWRLSDVACFVERVHALELRAVLAGSLSFETIRQLAPLRPDVIAVRGAACRGERGGTLDAARVRELLSLVEVSFAAAERKVARRAT